MWAPVSNELRKRILSALVLVPLVLAGFFVAPQPVPQVLVGVAWILSLREWHTMLNAGKTAAKSNYFRLAVVGYIYICFAFFGLWSAAEGDLKLLGFMLAVTWTTDTAAYFVGRALKGPKLAPSISPGKTWSGALGGALATGALGVIIVPSTFMPALYMFSIALAASIIAQIGDLIESKAKRILGVKDSGQLIPGHGGILDRLDSLIALGCVFGMVTFAGLIFNYSISPSPH
ncbi:MAG: phosphatidate cytidylyltransferase [Holosporales bacterium]